MTLRALWCRLVGHSWPNYNGPVSCRRCGKYHYRRIG